METANETPLPTTYAEALSQLEQIVAQMQSDKIDIDDLSRYTKHALDLLRLCKQRLAATDEELKKILSTLES